MLVSAGGPVSAVQRPLGVTERYGSDVDRLELVEQGVFLLQPGVVVGVVAGEAPRPAAPLRRARALRDACELELPVCTTPAGCKLTVRRATSRAASPGSARSSC